MGKFTFFNPNSAWSNTSPGFRKSMVLVTTGLLAASMSFAQLAGGTYTINSGNPTSGTNFNSFTDFQTALTTAGNGISGNVILNVATGSGPYTEQLVLPHVQGTGPGPGTTRIGIVVNGNGETIQHAGTSTNHAVILLNGMDYFTANDLVIKNTGTSEAYGVRIGMNADHNRFDNCTFDMTSSSTYYQSTGLLVASSDSYSARSANNGEYVEAWDCTFIGGYYGARFNGGTSSAGPWPMEYDVTGCDFQNQNYYGIYTYYVYNVDFNGNTLDFANTNNNFGYGTYFQYTNNLNIEGNSMTNSKAYGFRVYYCNYYNTGVVSGRSKFVNNMHQGGFNYSSYGYPMYFYRANEMDIVYNSFQSRGSSLTSTTYGLFSGYCANFLMQNNSVQSESSSSSSNYQCYVYGLTGTTSFDYNSFYTEGTERYYYNTAYSSLSALQSGSSTNGNSQFADPGYVSTTDNHINGANLYQKGNAYTGTLIDFDGTTRPSTQPSIGAHEFTPPQNDAGVSVFNAPVAVCPDTNDVIVTVKNYGAQPLASFKVHWTIYRGATLIDADSMAVTATVALAPGADTMITVSNVIMAAGSPNYDFLAWTTKPNAVTDEQFNNDTASWSTQTAMFGTYTIGGTSPSFVGFTQAVAALNTFDVCGAVTFNVRGGTYTERLELGALAGVSSTNTITFQADSANTSPVELEFNGTGASTDGVVVLDGTGYVTIDGISIEALNASGFGTCVWLKSTTDITIKNCSLLVNPSANDINLYIQSTQNSVFHNNVILEGGVGIYLFGNSNNYDMDNVFTDNWVEDVDNQGMYCYYQENVHIEGNHIDARKSTASITSYGLYMYCYNANQATIKKNYFGGHYYGAYIYMGGRSTNSPEITNNKFQCGDNNLTTSYAIYGVYMYAGFATFAHNLVVSESNYSFAYYNFYVNGGLNKVYNNVFARYGMGRAFYAPGSFALAECDHNAYATYDGATDGLSYAQGLGHGANSVEIDTSGVLFANLDSLYTCNDSLVARGLPLSMVADDINTFSRSTTTPTIGPEEYVSPGAFTLGEDFSMCSGDTVYIGQEVFGATYLWSPNSQTTGVIEITTPGTYGLSMVTGCGNADDDITIISGDAVAAFGATNSWLTAVFVNGSLMSDSYSWDFGDGSALSTDMSPSHAYAATGTYNVCLTVVGECGTDMTCQDVYVTNYLGIDDVDAANAVNIYPNPASDVLTIDVSSVEGDVLNIEISNVAGQVILTRQLNDFNGNAKEKIDITDLTKGVFLVKVYTEDMTTTKRLVVQK